MVYGRDLKNGFGGRRFLGKETFFGGTKSEREASVVVIDGECLRRKTRGAIMPPFIALTDLFAREGTRPERRHVKLAHLSDSAGR